MSLQRLKSNRERRNLSIDATIVASGVSDSHLPPSPYQMTPMGSPIIHHIARNSKAQAILSNNLNIMSPRTLPASLDRENQMDAVQRIQPHGGNSCFLLYGMVVSCLATDRPGFLASEGLNSIEVRIEKLNMNMKQTLDAVDRSMNNPTSNQSCRLVSSHFKDCLFEIIPKMSYDAAAQFEEAQRNIIRETSEFSGFSDEYSDLKFKRESESRLNTNIYQKLHGSVVKYGQVIQLRHVKSGLFITRNSNNRHGGDAIEISLGDGSTAAHFTLLPRFKLRKTGEPVQLVDQIILASGDKSHKLSLYVSNRKTSNGESSLVIGSTSYSSQWRFIPFDNSNKEVSSVDKFQQNYSHGLQAGHCIRLLHLEMGSWLGCTTDNRVSLNAEMEEDDSYLNQYQQLSPHNLWEVERTSMFEGGILQWNHYIQLRHVASGLYLGIQSIGQDKHQVCIQSEAQAFMFCPTSFGSITTSVGLDSAVQILHIKSNMYIHATASKQLQIPDIGLDIGNCTTLGIIPDSRDEDAFKIVSVSQAELDNTQILASYANQFRSYIRYFSSKETIDLSVLSQVERTLEKLKSFTISENQSNDIVTTLRQSLLRQHKIVSLLTEMLQAPFVQYGGPFTMEQVSPFSTTETHEGNEIRLRDVHLELDEGLEPNRTTKPTSDSGSNITNLFSDATMRAISRILCAVNVLLFRIFYSSKTADALSCRRAMPILMQLLGHNFHASVPLSYLIQEKFHLSESFASFSSLIRNFLDLIKHHGKTAQYLQFLVVLCSADGHAIPKIQERICELLFNPIHGYSQAALVQIRSNKALEFEIYLPSGQNEEWKSLVSFYDEYYEAGEHGTLAPYFYGLLQLYGALCMDRNYTCINSIKENFPRATLVASFQDVRLSRSIRAAFLNLLLVLHIDCEPQKPVACPNYTRIWKEIDEKNHSIPKAMDSWYTSEDWEFFENLKDILLSKLIKSNGILVISEYPENMILLATIKTCHKMIEFGLFRTIIEFSELIQQLIRLLDCRTDYWDIIPKSQKKKNNNDISFISPQYQRNSESIRFNLKIQNEIIYHTKNTIFHDDIRRDSLEKQYSKKKEKILKQNYIFEFSNERNKKKKLNYQNDTKLKFQSSKWNQIIMDIKDEICGILIYVDSIRLDYEISSILIELSKESKNKTIEFISKNQSPYSLSVLAKRSIHTVLLQALMYEHPPLVSKVLELFLQQFNHYDHLMKALGNVLLLVDDETVQNYDKLKKDVERLRQLAETTEVWMDLTSPSDFQVANQVHELLISFLKILGVNQTESIDDGNVQEKFKNISSFPQYVDAGETRTSTIPLIPQGIKKDFEPIHTSQIEIKRLLRNLDAMKTVLNMLRDGSHFFKIYFPSILQHQEILASPLTKQQTYGNKLQQQTTIRMIFSTCMRFLTALCDQNQLNQTYLAENVLGILDFVEELDQAQDLLTTVYSTYLPLCQCVPVKVVGKYIALWCAEIQSIGFARRRILEFLGRIIVCNGEIIPENQTLVLSQIMKCPPLLKHINERIPAFLHLLESKQLDEIDDCGHILYHIEFFELFSACARGKNMKLKEICSLTMPFPHLLTFLESILNLKEKKNHFNWYFNIERAAINLLFDIYFTSDLFHIQPLNEEFQSRLFHVFEILIIQYVLNDTKNLFKIDLKSKTIPQSHVIYDGNNTWVDMSYRTYEIETKECTGIVFKDLFPSLHLIFHDQNLISIENEQWKWIYMAIYVYLATNFTAVVLNGLNRMEQDILHHLIQVLDKSTESNALEILFYDTCNRNKRPFLGNLTNFIDSNRNDMDQIQILFDMFHSPSSTIANQHVPSRGRSSSPIARRSILQGIEILPVPAQISTPPEKKLEKKELKWNFMTFLFKLNQIKRKEDSFQNPSRINEIQDENILENFLKRIQTDINTQLKLKKQLDEMIQCILHVEESLFHEHETHPDIPLTTTTLDDIILKLVDHFKLLKQSKFSKVSILLLDVFSQMIETLEKSKRHAMQLRLNSLGLPALVVTILSTTDDSVIFDRSIQLGISLLDGMNAKIQENFYQIWRRNKNSKAFERIKQRIDKISEGLRQELDGNFELLGQKHQRKWKQSVQFIRPASTASMYTSIVQIFRFLQLLCEGHFIKVQRYMIAQRHTHNSINLVEATTTFLLEIHGTLCASNAHVIKQLFDTVTEFCQGPCTEAQECVANYKFISAVNELMVVSSSPEYDENHLRELKGSIVTALLSLIEGRTDTIIHDRLVTELNFDTLKDNLIQVHKYFIIEYKNKYDGNSRCSTDPYLTMGFHLHILMQHLMEHQPNLNETLRPKHFEKEQVNENSMKFSYQTLSMCFQKIQEEKYQQNPYEERDLWYSQAYSFFQSKCGRVEILWRREDTSHQLIPVYFPIHPICCCLTDRSKHRLKWSIQMDGGNKLAEFYSRTTLLLDEMEYSSQLLERKFITKLASLTPFIQKLSFIVAIVLNGVLLATYRADDDTSIPYLDLGLLFPGSNDLSIDFFFSIVGIIQIILCSLLFLVYCTHTAPLLVMEGWNYEKIKLKSKLLNIHKINHYDDEINESLQDVEDLLHLLGDRNINKIQNRYGYIKIIQITFRFLLFDHQLLYHGIFILFAIFGTFLNSFFFSFQLLDIINRSRDLKNVLKAVFYPGRSLLLIVVLYLFLVYIFSFLGFLYFRPDYQPDHSKNISTHCSTLFLCFLTSLDQGFKQNGGLGAFLTPRIYGIDQGAYERFLFDLLYNVILIIILLNISFGIIVDTFATIRTTHKEKIDELHDRCFICSIDGYTFERLTKRGFQYHTHMEHNMWHYLYLFVHINKKDYTEYNGMELYLAMRMAKNDVSFFPNHRALALEKLQSDWNDGYLSVQEYNKIVKNDPEILKMEEIDRIEKKFIQLFENQNIIREKQNEMDEIQRQILTSQQEILMMMRNEHLGSIPIQTRKKSQHFFVQE